MISIVKRPQAIVRWFSTFSVMGVRVQAAKEPKAIRVTGFNGNFLPTKEDFHMIFKKALRPEITKEKVAIFPRVPDDPDDLFEYFSAEWSTATEGEIIFRLKDESLLKSLPIARRLEDLCVNDANLFTRTAWCGLLLPILNKKIVTLDRQTKAKMKNSKTWDSIRWYSLVFRPFEADTLMIRGVSEDNVRQILQKNDQEIVLEKIRTPKIGDVQNVLRLQCASTEEAFQIREYLANEGLSCRVLSTKGFDLQQTFLRFRDGDQDAKTTSRPSTENLDNQVASGATSDQKEVLELEMLTPFENEQKASHQATASLLNSEAAKPDEKKSDAKVDDDFFTPAKSEGGVTEVEDYYEVERVPLYIFRSDRRRGGDSSFREGMNVEERAYS